MVHGVSAFLPANVFLYPVSKTGLYSACCLGSRTGIATSSQSSRLANIADILQALWLQQGYELEFLGKSTFVPGLWLASMVFFAVNCWILGIIVSDIGSESAASANPEVMVKKVR